MCGSFPFFICLFKQNEREGVIKGIIECKYDFFFPEKKNIWTQNYHCNGKIGPMKYEPDELQLLVAYISINFFTEKKKIQNPH